MAGFLPNPRFNDELKQEGEVQQGLADAVEDTRALAETYANRIMPRPGRQHVEVVERDGDVFIVNTDYGGHLDEFGSRKNPLNASLRRAADATGLRVELQPKP